MQVSPTLIFRKQDRSRSRHRTSPIVSCSIAFALLIPASSIPTAIGGDTDGGSSQQSTESSSLTSSEIRHAIEADLDDTESLNANRIRVSVDNGLVTLSGAVSSLMDRAPRVDRGEKDS